MKAITTTITNQQNKKLQKLVHTTGIKKAEHIRRALDAYFLQLPEELRMMLKKEDTQDV